MCGYHLSKIVVQLAKCEFIQAVVLLYPSFISVDDINGKGYVKIQLLGIIKAASEGKGHGRQEQLEFLALYSFEQLTNSYLRKWNLAKSG
ncbi:uncharacterized protein [Euphorbia lathyris]|uniref:uncharacterized protein isoform X2 n=1 Tax=Euphorbia lathyris TaxID=212925 RepID=UPI0033144C84